MARLAPPIIEGKLPAFCRLQEGDFYLEIPYSMNPTVGRFNIKGFSLVVKSTLGEMISGPHTSYKQDDFKVTFILPSEKFQEGIFYKFQLAYIDKNNTVGYYSTIGLAKCIKEPRVSISELTHGQLNMHQPEYIGIYEDTNGSILPEKVYSYCFNVYDANGNLYDTSGEIVHDNSKDVDENISYDKFILNKGLENNLSYSISYNVKTINGFTFENPTRYRIMIKESIDPQIEAVLEATTNYDNGYVNLRLVGKKDPETGLETVTTGAFLISRASDKDNFITWEEVYRFNLSAQKPSRLLWRDYTTEQGHTYKYALQQYNDFGLYSNRMETNEVCCDFEDAFLFDGKRQLKIKYNPKVSSFKTDVLETKVETIGSKHPFIFRNGNVNYKEFPISGLVSYFMDEESIFTQIPPEEDRTTNLISENIKNERNFKLSVLDWLNNGEVKLFRSPTEGNYIVRLMNVSMSPDDTLGRMLHTFSCTAYEIADYTYKEMNKYDLIHIERPETKYLHFKTIDLYKEKYDGVENLEEIDPHKQWPTAGNISAIVNKINKTLDKRIIGPIETVRFQDMMPGDAIYIEVDPLDPNGQTISGSGISEKFQKIVIGATGSYMIDTGMSIPSIYVPSGVFGNITYSYYTTVSNVFDMIQDVENIDIPLKQFIGEHSIIKEIEDIKTTLLKVHSIKAQKRNIQVLYTDNNNNLYIDPNLHIQAPVIRKPSGQGFEYEWLNIEDYFVVYKIMKLHSDKWIFDRYLDAFNNKEYLNINDYKPSFVINGNLVDLDITDTYEATDLEGLKSLETNLGVMLECCYQIRILTYNLEEENESTKEAKDSYNDQYSIWFNKKTEEPKLEDLSDEQIVSRYENARINSKINYDNFIKELTKAYKKEMEARE